MMKLVDHPFGMRPNQSTKVNKRIFLNTLTWEKKTNDEIDCQPAVEWHEVQYNDDAETDVQFKLKLA